MKQYTFNKGEVMGKLRNNEKGFGAVEGLLIVAVVVLIGVVGYMVTKTITRPLQTALQQLTLRLQQHLQKLQPHSQ